MRYLKDCFILIWYFVFKHVWAFGSSDILWKSPLSLAGGKTRDKLITCHLLPMWDTNCSVYTWLSNIESQVWSFFQKWLFKFWNVLFLFWCWTVNMVRSCIVFHNYICIRNIIRLCYVILLNASGDLFIRGAMETIRELLSDVYHLPPLSPPAVSGRNKGCCI